MEQKKGTAFYIPAEGGIKRSTVEYSFEQLLNNNDRSQAVAVTYAPFNNYFQSLFTLLPTQTFMCRGKMPGGKCGGN